MNAFVKTGKIFFLAILTLLLAWPTSGTAEEAGALSAAPVFELPPARGAADLSGLEALSSPRDDASQAGGGQGPSVQSGSGSAVVDTALGLFGLPGMSSAADDDGSAYEKAWRMRNGPGGSTRLTYGERYRRNPDGSYGVQSSSRWNGAGVADQMLEQALSAGSGWFSSWAEGWLGGYGKARIQLRINDEGEVTGAGDFLLPLYDSEYTAVFTQLGLRTMAGDRVIGNFGLGQRFFPAENFAFGYNAFIDQDFSRNHSRGGLGLEAWYDWLRLSANYYTPLSGWKASKDYDSRLVEERPAEGYDARLTGYLPFYRNLAVTGAFEQWKGDRVGSFGSNDVVRKDPKVWSYGLEWTPVPAFSASVNQRHSGSQKETQFGLTFNYLFGMDWEDQLSPAMVAEMRTVDGSRHDFVNRQNEIILEYQAKNAYRIEYLGLDGARGFLFRIRDGFGEYKAGQTVWVTASGNYLAEAAKTEPQSFFAQAVNFLDELISVKAAYAADLSKTYVTDGQGRFWIQLDPSAPAAATVTIQAGDNSQTFTLAGGGMPVSGRYSIAFSGVPGSPVGFTGSGTGSKAALNGVTITVLDTQNSNQPVDNTTITLSASMTTTNQAVIDSRKTQFYGLKVNTMDGGAAFPSVPLTTNASGQVTLNFEDIVGERTLSLTATVTDPENRDSAANTSVTFGLGPLSAFRLPDGHSDAVPSAQWADVYPINTATSLPAAALCGTPPSSSTFQSWTAGDHSSETGLPTRTELETVANVTGNQAWVASGWPDDYYWPGELYNTDYARMVIVGNGSNDNYGSLDDSFRVVCRR